MSKAYHPTYFEPKVWHALQLKNSNASHVSFPLSAVRQSTIALTLRIQTSAGFGWSMFIALVTTILKNCIVVESKNLFGSTCSALRSSRSVDASSAAVDRSGFFSSSVP